MSRTFYFETLYPFQDRVLQVLNEIETGFPHRLGTDTLGGRAGSGAIRGRSAGVGGVTDIGAVGRPGICREERGLSNKWYCMG